jgi:hypothetical protein
MGYQRMAIKSTGNRSSYSLAHFPYHPETGDILNIGIKTHKNILTRDNFAPDQQI